ncbi:peptidoglycan-binding protein [Actinokineospora sp. NPDC004072]
MATEFDERLRQRLLAFQEHHGLTCDGVADAQTWDTLVNTAAPSGGPTSAADARARALEIDQQVQADPNMSTAELQRLMQERDQLLALTEHPPAVQVAAPAPEGLSGAIPLAAGMLIVPTTSAPGAGLPPSVLFGAGAAESGVVTGAGAGAAAAEVTAAEAGAAAAEAIAAEVGAAAAGAVAAETGTAAAVGTTAAVAEAGAAAAGGAATIPVAGWVVAGVIVIGVVSYLVYRHYNQPERAEAPSGATGGPVTDPPAVPTGPAHAPGAPQSGPVSAPGQRTAHGPMSLPAPPTRVEQLQASSPEIESARHRLDELERSGRLFRDVRDLRDRLGAADERIRRAAQAELTGLEREVADYERLQRGEDIGTPRSVPLTERSAFEELMHRYPPPLNRPPYNQWSREHFTPVRLQPDDLSDDPAEVKRVLVIRAPNGHELRFSVVWRDGVYQDIHESSGPSDRQQ